MATGVIPHSGLFGKGGMFLSEATFPEELTYFSENDDLNTAKYTIPGKYNIPSAAVGNTIKNRPESNLSMFFLLVYNPSNSEMGALGTNTYRYRLRILITWSGQMYMQRAHCEANTTIIYDSWQKINMTAL